MSTNAVSTYLKFANLQMASEATKLDQYLSGAIDLKKSLTDGNNRSSKFANTLADQFTADWTVVAHQSNTNTGFSGTLFRATKNNASLGITVGEFVMSFRSTEFADDAVHDNQATNVMEIKEFGWAFGQIDDMKKWVDGLYAAGTIPPATPLSVTGYSLGGHLATAFNLLYPGAVRATYTFNGAGVGAVDKGSLSSVIAQFDRQRLNISGKEIIFTDPRATAQYKSLHAKLTGGVAATWADINGLSELLEKSSIDKREGTLLIDAVKRIKMITDEIDRLTRVTNSGPAIVQVAASAIDATKLDYQLAALLAARSTSGVRTHVALGGWDSYSGRNAAPGGAVPNFYDIFGANAPSAVSNSQLHYGQPTPVFIEDQPLYRGSVILDAAAASISNAEAKLLVSDFSRNDFGDTHSLVLLVDSLSVQNMLATLDPVVSTATLNSVLQSASKAKGTSLPWTQGDAEGDVLENTLDAVRRIVQGPSIRPTPANMEGGSWADIKDRNVFHENLKALTDSRAFQSIAGKVSIRPSAGIDLASKARNDFSALASLITLSPLVITATDTANNVLLSTVLQGVWGPVYADWQADRALSPAERQDGKQNFSHDWLDDRATLLESIDALNIKNGSTIAYSDGLPADRSYELRWLDASGATQALIAENTARKGGVLKPVASQLIQFGSDGPDTLNGTDNKLGDHLYGSAGADTLNGLGGGDHLEGGAGDDSLDGGEGADALLGGTGNDTLRGGDGADTLLGGDGTDTLFGDAGADTLYGGEGADVLDGGADNDQLHGGAGLDTYRFSGAWGHDTIDDSDGLGHIEADGRALPASAKMVAVGSYRDKASGWTYSLAGGDLIALKDGRADGITIRGWQPGQLGITLDDTPLPATPPTSVLTGGADHAEQDSLFGSAAADLVQGLDGNDLLAGRAGDDRIEGGEGDDLIAGGLGADTLLGGAGNDWIYGSGWASGWNDAVSTPDDFAVPDGASVIMRGYKWALYDDGRSIVTGGVDMSPLAGDAGNVIDGGAGNDVIHAGTGNDVVHGGDDRDWIQGLAGNDVLFGDAGDDVVWGDGNVGSGDYLDVPGAEHGNDVLAGGAGDDHLYGQGGDDELYGGTGDDKLYGDTSALYRLDLPQAFDGRDTLDGGAGDDWMEGGQRDDTLFGGSGNDTLFGDGAGNNEAATFEGRDWIDAGAGDDIASGGGNDDTVLGGDGKDQLWGDGAGSDASNQGRDRIDGDDGDDTLVGGGNDDELSGGNGNDQLFGDDVQDRVAVALHGRDRLDGGDGDDQLTGGSGDDTLLGGDGNDFLRGDDDIANVAASAHGDDTLDGGAGDDVLYGDGGNDVLLGGEGDDMLAGGDGRDVLDGGTGRNSLFGGTGDDTLISAGGDWLDGGEGDDTFIVSKAAGNTNSMIADGQGTDTLAVDGETVAADDLRVFAQGDSVVLALAGHGLVGIGAAVDLGRLRVQVAAGGSAASGSLSLQQIITAADAGGRIASGMSTASGIVDTALATRALALRGGTRDDALNGGTGSDTLDGGAGSDRVAGGAGGDTLFGGAGADIVVGGTGADTLFGGDAEGRDDGAGDTFVFALGDGVDRIKAATVATPGQPARNVIRFGPGITAAGVRLSMNDAGTGVGDGDVVIDYSSVDRLTMASGAFAQVERIAFDDGTSLSHAQMLALLDARAPDDAGIVKGTPENDTLIGGAAATALYGFAGDDVLQGGAGDDRLVGGPGSNTYVFGAAGGKDVIEPTPAATADGSAEQALLRFTAARLSELAVAIEGFDLVITQPSGSLVRLRSYLESASLADWHVEDQEGASLTLGALLRRPAASPATTDLSERRAVFLATQLGQLATLGQRYNLSTRGQGVIGSAAMVVPRAVTTISQKVAPGTAFTHASYLTVIDTVTTTHTTTQVPDYATVTVNKPAEPGHFVARKSPGDTFVPSGATLVYGPVEKVASGTPGESSTGYGRNILGYVTAEVGASTTTQRQIVGWHSVTTARASVASNDTATQAIVEGTAGEDSIAPTASLSKYPTLFRGAIDTGAGNDVVALATGSNTGWSADGSRHRDWDTEVPSLYGSNYPFQGYVVSDPQSYQRGLGAWIDLGAGDDRVSGSDGDDFIVGGTGSDRMNGQAGADTYFISRDDGSVDRISDLARTDVGYYGDALVKGMPLAISPAIISIEVKNIPVGPANEDTVEFDSNIALRSLSYRWNDAPIDRDDPHFSFYPLRTLELYQNGRHFLDIDYLPGTDSYSYSKAGVENFRFADGRVLARDGLLSAIPEHVSSPVRLTAPFVDVETLEKAALRVELAPHFTARGGLPITFAATLADGSALPGFMTLDTATGVITGLPGNDAVGAYALRVRAATAAGSVDAGFRLRVDNVNDAPTVVGSVADSLEPLPVATRAAFSWVVPAGLFNDIDIGDTLTFAAALPSGSALPAWLKFDAGTRTLSGIRPAGDESTLVVAIRAADGAGAAAVALVEVSWRDAAGRARIIGTAAGDVFYGSAGNDDMDGLAGNDVLSGRAGDDTLVGGAGDDWLDGGTGFDVLVGGTGDDTFVVDRANDVVKEQPGEGTDTVRAGVTWTLGSDLENLTLTGVSSIDGIGNALANILTGNSGANRLDGRDGADTMTGGAGDDTYYVDNIGDITLENPDQGTDTVNASLSWRLGANLENLTLTGTAAISGTGNELSNMLTGNNAANVLTGGGGDDVLNGGAGADRLIGGSGNDTYFVDNLSDTVFENLGEGTDLVNASLSWTLGSNSENLTLTGTAAIDGTGNELNNVLAGNAAANRLAGGAGNDTLDGGTGADILVGGTGADIYRFGTGYGIDTIQENDAAAGVRDAVQFVGSLTKADVRFRQAGDNLEVSLAGTGDRLVVQNWYLGSPYRVEEFRFSDGAVVLDSQVQSLVSAMASFAAPAAGEAPPMMADRGRHDMVIGVLAPSAAM